MSDRLGAMLGSGPASLRRFVWRLGRRLYTSARREQISLEIEGDGEGYLQSCVVRAIDPGRPLTIMDIGANQGDWTRHLLANLPPDRKTSSRLKVILFEPVPSTRARLASTIAAHDLGGVCAIHPIAMSDVKGTFEMAIMSDTGGTNSLHFDNSAAAPPGGWISIQTDTLSGFFTEHGIDHAHLVKCDTEGHDLKVMQGARDLLAQKRIDVFQFEYNHRWVFSHSFLKDVFDLIDGLPYRLGRLMPDGVEYFSRWHPELDRFFQSNYVLVSERAMTWLNSHSGTFDDSNTYA